MKIHHLPLIAGLLFFLVAELPAEQPGQSPETEAGFVPIFNGKNLDGWEGDKTLWKAQEGMLVGDSHGISQNEFLATKKQGSIWIPGRSLQSQP